MTDNRSSDAAATKEEFAITRTVDAPLNLVWEVFTHAKHLSKWWGPKGLSIGTCEIELKPGGTFWYSMHADNGFEMWGKWTFTEIAPKQRIGYISTFSDKEGGVTRHPLEPNWPEEMLCSITFKDLGDRTEITITARAINANELEQKTFDSHYDSMDKGFGGTFEQLVEYLKAC